MILSDRERECAMDYAETFLARASVYGRATASFTLGDRGILCLVLQLDGPGRDTWHRMVTVGEVYRSRILPTELGHMAARDAINGVLA